VGHVYAVVSQYNAYIGVCISNVDMLSLVPRFLPSFLLHTIQYAIICNKKAGEEPGNEARYGFMLLHVKLCLARNNICPFQTLFSGILTVES